MAELPPNKFEFAASASAADRSAAPGPSESPSGAADEYEALLDCIGEIFAGARKLFDPDPAAYTAEDELLYDVLRSMDDPHTPDLVEMPYGMEGIFDPAPLFLRQESAA